MEASTDEIKTISEQLTVAVNLSLKLETQLNEARAAAQTANNALTEEKKITTAGKNQLAMTQKSLLAEKNSVKALRGSVDQALEALQELNRDTVALADELDKSKKKNTALEVEISSLRQKFTKEKEAASSLRAGVTQAGATIGKLTKERDSGIRKMKDLEGEILKSRGESVRQKEKLMEMKRALQVAESRVNTIPEVCCYLIFTFAFFPAGTMSS